MTWSLETSRGNESAKIRWEALPYVRGAGLDIGCGPWKCFHWALGIDGQKAPGVQLVMDGTRLALFADGVFDFVFSSHFLEHVEDTRAALAEWWRVLKVGGHLVLYLPHADLYPRIGEPGSNPDHKHDFDLGDIHGALQANGVNGNILRAEVRGEADEYSFFLVVRKEMPGYGLGHLMDWHPTIAPAKRAAIVRPGAYGDSLWASSPAAHLAEQGYEVTVYTEGPGAEILAQDPNIARIIHIAPYMLSPEDAWDYYRHEAPKYERFVMLTHAVEKNGLATDNDLRWYWPDDVRREAFAGNYFDRIHDLAGVPRELRLHFYPTVEEDDRARERHQAPRLELADSDAPVAVLVASGSTAPKFWPYLDELSRRLLEAGYAVVILGDLRGWQPEAERPGQHVIGTDWPIRDAIAFAQLADLVIGQETAITNAVAMEPMRKVILLSHSTHQNLTRDWVNTAALAGGVPCYPCHRIHQTLAHCMVEPRSGAAGCQAAISAEAVMRAAIAEEPRSIVIKRQFNIVDKTDQRPSAPPAAMPVQDRMLRPAGHPESPAQVYFWGNASPADAPAAPARDPLFARLKSRLFGEPA